MQFWILVVLVALSAAGKKKLFPISEIFGLPNTEKAIRSK